MPLHRWKNSASVQPNSSSSPIGGADEPLHRGEGLVRYRRGDQPPGQQQRADAKPDAGDAVQDRQDRADRPADRPADAATAGGGPACRRCCAPPSARRGRLSMDRSILSAGRGGAPWTAPLGECPSGAKPLRLLTLPEGKGQRGVATCVESATPMAGRAERRTLPALIVRHGADQGAPGRGGWRNLGGTDCLPGTRRAP